MPDFKSNNIVMSARVYFMKTVNGCKDVPCIIIGDKEKNRVNSKFFKINYDSVF